MRFAGLDDSLIPLLIFGLPLLIRLFKGDKKKKAQRAPTRSAGVKGELGKVSRSLRQVSDELNRAAGGSRTKDGVRRESPARGGTAADKEELPAWLSNLVDEVGGTIVREEPVSAAEIEVLDVNPVGVEEISLSAWGSESPEASASAIVEETDLSANRRVVADAADYHVKRRRRKRRAGGRSRRLRSCPGRTDWRRAVVLSEILGKPRALRDWRDLESTG